MKIRFGCAMVVMILFAGCNSNSDVPEIAADAQSKIAQRDSMSADSVTDTQRLPNSVVANPGAVATSQEVQALVSTLKELTETAQKLESEFRFAESAKAWHAVLEKVSAEFGPDSWQAVNARLSRDFARKVASFGEAQAEALRQIRHHTQQGAQHSAKGQTNRALESANEANRLLVEQFGPNSAPVGRQLLQIAAMLMESGLSEQAASECHRAISILGEHGMVDHPEIEQAHARLAAIYSQRGKFDQAISNQKSATRIAEKVWGDNSVNYALQANQLGVIFHRAGQSETAMSIFKACEAIRRNHLGPGSPQVAHSHMNIGIVQQSLHQYAEALASFDKARQILMEAEKRDDPILVESLSKSATIYMIQKQLGQAQQLLETVVGILSENSEITPVQLAGHQYRLAIALAKQGKYDRAQPLLEQILEVQKSAIGESHGETLKTMRAYALVLKQTHQTQAAARINQRIQHVAAQSSSNEFRR